MQLNNKITKLEQQIKELNQSLDQAQLKLNRLIRVQLSKDKIVCPTCNESGDERCVVCEGLGILVPEKCKCGFIIKTNMINIRKETTPRCPQCNKLISIGLSRILWGEDIYH